MSPDKCQLLLISRNLVRINIGGHIIQTSIEEKLLRMKIDSHLWLESHVSKICKNVSKSYMLFQELQTARTLKNGNA